MRQSVQQSEVLTIGGITYDDPFLWLEQDSPATLAWQTGQDDAARAYLHGLPGFAQLAQHVAPHLREMHTFAPRQASDTWFWLEPACEQACLRVATDPKSAGTVLVNPAELDFMAIEWFFPSPDGTHVAVGLRPDLDSESELHVIEVNAGTFLPVTLPHASQVRVAWLPDSSGFYVNAGLPTDTTFARYLFQYRLASDQRPEPEPLSLRSGQVFPQVSADGRYVAAVVSFTTLRPDYLKDTRENLWRPFLRDHTGTYCGEFLGDRYLAVTDDLAPRGRVVSIPLEDPANRDGWLELVPESDAVIRGLAIINEHLVLSEVVDGASRIRSFALQGDGAGTASERVAPLPANGAIGTDGRTWSHMPIEEPTFAASDRLLSFVFSSHTRSPGTMSYDPATGTLETISPSRFDRTDLVTERVRCQAADGESVGMWLVHRPDLDPSAPHPTVIYGYGGWNNAFLPFYLGGLIPFVDAGGIVALPNLRGGGEAGHDWWRQGRLEGKQTTFNDLYACAEWLVDNGLTHTQQLAVLGQSNGGLLASAALTQRPELFACAVVLVPVLEMMRYDLNVLGPDGYAEYGDPHDPTQAPFLYAYSPYHNIGHDRHPATLVVCAEHDTACPAWQSRKFVARLQAETKADAPILFRYWHGSEHLAGEIATPEQSAEWVAFLMHTLGLSHGEPL